MKKLNKMRNNKGFTLIELIIVVAIIAMLIAMIAPNLTSFLDSASDTTLNANAKAAYTTANAWATQQRVNGNKTDGKTVVLESDGSAITVKIDGSAVEPGNMYSDLNGLFSAAEIGADGSISITFTTKNSVSSVTWTSGSESATYPTSSSGE